MTAVTAAAAAEEVDHESFVCVYVNARTGEFVHAYQGFLRTQRSFIPASVRILIEAASQALTVSFTDCMRFWALPTSISVASRSSSDPAEKGDVALFSTVCNSLRHTIMCTPARTHVLAARRNDRTGRTGSRHVTKQWKNPNHELTHCACKFNQSTNEPTNQPRKTEHRGPNYRNFTFHQIQSQVKTPVSNAFRMLSECSTPNSEHSSSNAEE